MRLKLPHKPGPDIIHELAINLYPSSLESYREAISNSFDEGSKKVVIQNTMKQVTVEDWGEGIKDIDKFVEFGQYSKLGQGKIGKKGLGKLSLLRLGQNVNFRTNNGEYTLNIVMTPLDFDYDIGGSGKFLGHEGTKIIIDNPTEIPPTDELSDYLKKTFALRIAKGCELVLNDATLTSKVDPAEHLLCRLEGAVDVTGNLKADKRGHGAVDIYVEHVFVMQEMIDPDRAFSGWVNCNGLTPTTARNDLLKDKAYFHFMEHLKEHVAGKFPRKEEDLSREEMLLGAEVSNMLQNYLNHMKMLPQGMLPLGKGPNSFKGGKTRVRRTKDEVEHQKKEIEDVKERVRKTSQTENPVRRAVKSSYGLYFADHDIGNEKPPLYYLSPNTVIRNTGNDLYKFALKSKANLGPKWLRLLPYISRVAVSINPKSKIWTHEQMEAEIDSATRYFLHMRDEL